MTDIPDRLEALKIIDEVGSDNPLGREAAALIRELRSEIARLRAASEWRDISTAPRDGTSVILDAPEGVGEGHRSELDFRWTWADGEYVYPDPDHWMPLPAPPQRNEVKPCK